MIVKYRRIDSKFYNISTLRFFIFQKQMLDIIVAFSTCVFYVSMVKDLENGKRDFLFCPYSMVS